jgi:hypothetical protein
MVRDRVSRANGEVKRIKDEVSLSACATYMTLARFLPRGAFVATVSA